MSETATNFAGQIASLKDHLRIAGTRLNAAEDLLRRLVEQWDVSDFGEVVAFDAVVADARAHLDMAPPSVQSPITDAAIDAAKSWTPESWNTCPKCKNPVEKAGGDVFFFDGDEARCIACKTIYMVSFAEDGGPGSLYEPEQDQLAGLPEEERARIHTTARTEAIAAYNGGPEGGRSAAADGAYRAAVAREVAAYRAQNVPEMLDREEAEKRLLALDVRAIVGGRWADAEIEAWLSSPHESVRALEAAAVTGDKNPEVIRDRNEVLAILRAHVRWLDAQKSAAEHEPK